MLGLLVRIPSCNAQSTQREREREQTRAVVKELKTKLDGAEDSLNQTLIELESSKNEAKSTYSTRL